ncbi:Clp protease N-terminal domain-containing protein [Streptomyces sp. NPDC046203]|uniref:Clp protease N-terminal domain-containing protein n=1 Tax=Streptomyces sp. NPDC046203 TaxID=3154602 RepID=UPI0033C24315
MHNPVPSVPAPRPQAHRLLPAARRADLESVLTSELMTVVAGARRRTLRGGDRQIDTAHLLHSLVESDPEAGAAFEGGHQVARVLGYLVQRSIGYGLRWQRSVEETGTVLPVLRPSAEDAGSALPVLRPGEEPGPGLSVLRSGEDAGSAPPALRSGEDPGAALPVLRSGAENDPALPALRSGEAAFSGWSPAAAAALGGAFERAARRGERRARGLDLLGALAADPDSRAAEVLRRAGVDRTVLAARVGELSQQVQQGLRP